MKLELAIDVNHESQGVFTGESFAACARQMFDAINTVHEQFPAEYIAAICRCLWSISNAIVQDGGDGCLTYEMDGDIASDTAMACGDLVYLVLRLSAE